MTRFILFLIICATINAFIQQNWRFNPFKHERILHSTKLMEPVNKLYNNDINPSNDIKLGVLLLNLGGPETMKDVEGFLYNLFADPDIIRLPKFLSLLQKPLAYVIAKRRYFIYLLLLRL